MGYSTSTLGDCVDSLRAGKLGVLRSVVVLGGVASVLVGLAGTAEAGARQATTTIVSVSTAGAQAFKPSVGPVISTDGRTVAFVSDDAALVPGDTNIVGDVFVRDLKIGTTTRVSVSSSGAQSDAGSSDVGLSTDGRYVVFSSVSGALTPGDTNGDADVFVHDRMTRSTTRVSDAAGGSAGNGSSFGGVISGDGRYVAFQSFASNLVPGDTNGAFDVFIHDRRTHQTTRVSRAFDGGPGNSHSFGAALSRDGRLVGFLSDASNLVPGDTNGFQDVFLWDRRSGTTSRVSVASNGAQANAGSFRPVLSADGRTIGFASAASNLVPADGNEQQDVFVRDLRTGTVTLVSVASDGSQGNGASFGLSVSANGRYIAFPSFASNLVSADGNEQQDVFVRDLRTGTTTLVSVASDGVQGNGASSGPSISGSGQRIAFESQASNLVSEDRNSTNDVFLRSG